MKNIKNVFYIYGLNQSVRIYIEPLKVPYSLWCTHVSHTSD